MPKGPCDKKKRTKDPKCTDHPECDWYPGRGCYPKETVFEDKKSKKSKKTSKKPISEAEQAAMLLMSMKESKPNLQRYAKVFVAEWEFDFSYPNFPIETVYVKNKDDILDECYAPEWIYRKETRTNHIKCISDDEHRRLATKYYKDMDIQKIQEFKEFTTSIVEEILSKGGNVGDLVENANETGYRTNGLYILDYDIEGDIVIAKLDTEYDGYGTIPTSFTLSEQYKSGYWTDAFEKGQFIYLIDQKSERDGANWYENENQPEPLHISKLKGLKKSQFSIRPGEDPLDDSGIVIDLGFIKLLYYADKSIDELYQALKSKDANKIFYSVDSSFMVPPMDNNEALLREVDY